jgi:hypothetical protein
MEPKHKSRRKPDKSDGLTDPHVRVPYAVMDSPAWQAASLSAIALYMDARRLLGPTNNGDIAFTPNRLRSKAAVDAGEKCRWNHSATTLAKALLELQALGLIAKTRASPGAWNGVPTPNLYRFTDRSVFEIPAKGIHATKPTNDFSRFRTLREALEHVDKANAERAAARAPQAPGKRRTHRKKALHILECDAPQNGVLARQNTPDSGDRPSKTLQKMETDSASRKPLKPPPEAASVESAQADVQPAQSPENGVLNN